MLSLLETLSLTFPHRQSVDDMASPQRNDDPNPEDTHDPSAEVTTCSNADVFRRINNLLSNALNFTNVCDTPPHYRTPEQPHGLSLVDNGRMRFTSGDGMSSDDMSSDDMSGAQEMPTFTDEQDVANMVPLFQSLSLSSWGQPWSSQETSMAYTSTPSSSPSMADSVKMSQEGYQNNDPLVLMANFLEKFPSLSATSRNQDINTYLDSCTNTTDEETETSGFSSGSERLCDMSNLNITPPISYLPSNMQRELQDVRAHTGPQSTSSPLPPGMSTINSPMTPQPPGISTNSPMTPQPPGISTNSSINSPMTPQPPGISTTSSINSHLMPQPPGVSTASFVIPHMIPRPPGYSTASFVIPHMIPQLPGFSTAPSVNSHLIPRPPGFNAASFVIPHMIPQRPGFSGASSINSSVMPQPPGINTPSSVNSPMMPQPPRINTPSSVNSPMTPQPPGINTPSSVNSPMAPQPPGVNTPSSVNSPMTPQLPGSFIIPHMMQRPPGISTTSFVVPHCADSQRDVMEPQGATSFEREAYLHCQAAALHEPSLSWAGKLPPIINKDRMYSCKVFLGGVPWDITEEALLDNFRRYGPVRVEWPGKTGKHLLYPSTSNVPKGYVYLIFENDKSVNSLLKGCFVNMMGRHEGREYYCQMSSRRMRAKDVQVIPWLISESVCQFMPSQHLDPSMTVFVGALHGMITAEALAGIMNDLFGGVMYVGLDTDKYRYPIGSGRVVFNNLNSYQKAMRAAFVEIKTSKFTKKVQIDPYLEESLCQNCSSLPGPYFCREQVCFKYFCQPCWQSHHTVAMLVHHRPIMRSQRNRDTS